MNTLMNQKTDGINVKKMMKHCSFALCMSIITQTLVTGANAKSIDYSMFESLFGEAITTSASGKPERVSDVPLTMEILTQEDIKRSGAVNIPEVLRQVNGVNVVQKSPTAYDVSIRGYNQHYSQRLLVLVNGRQVYMDYYGHVDWSSIPVQLDEIKQIEVVKGPNNALFGFNAVNGVINIITYNPRYDNKSSVTVTGGTHGYHEARGMKTFEINDRIHTRISGSYMEMNEFNNPVNSFNALAPGTTRSEFINPRRRALNSDTSFQINDMSDLRLELSWSNSEDGSIAADSSNINAKYETKSVKMSYSADSEFGLIKANIYKNDINADVKFTSLLPYTPIDNEVLVAQLEDTIQVNDNNIVRFQGEFRENETSSAGRLLPSAGSIKYNVYAFGGMWNTKLSDTLSWTNAARFDYLKLSMDGVLNPLNPFTEADYDNSLSAYSYNSGVAWQATDNDTFRLSTARGLELPSAMEYGIEVVSFGLAGNPYIGPAIVTNYELAWDRKINPLNGMLRSAIFYNRTDNVKTLLGGTINGVRVTNEIGASETYGIELALDGKINENFDWGVGYIFQKIDDDLRNGKTNNTITLGREYEDSNPVHQANVKLGFQKDNWEADTLIYYVSETSQISASPFTPFSNNLQEIDAYIGVNARLAYNFDNEITLAVHGQQLQSQNVQTSTTPDIDRRLFVSLSKGF